MAAATVTGGSWPRSSTRFSSPTRATCRWHLPSPRPRRRRSLPCHAVAGGTRRCSTRCCLSSRSTPRAASSSATASRSSRCGWRCHHRRPRLSRPAARRRQCGECAFRWCCPSTACPSTPSQRLWLQRSSPAPHWSCSPTAPPTRRLYSGRWPRAPAASPAAHVRRRTCFGLVPRAPPVATALAAASHHRAVHPPSVCTSNPPVWASAPRAACGCATRPPSRCRTASFHRLHWAATRASRTATDRRRPTPWR